MLDAIYMSSVLIVIDDSELRLFTFWDCAASEAGLGGLFPL